jgi:hypothetical protein
MSKSAPYQKSPPLALSAIPEFQPNNNSEDV